jgi:ATP-dependent DNA ligase
MLDGELLVETDDGFSFEALQARLHPAQSRIRKLAAATSAVLMAFDLLAFKGRPTTGKSLLERHALLEDFLSGVSDPHFQLSPGTLQRRTAERWLKQGRYEGVVAKRLSDPYQPGERAMIKVKRRRTADCVVGGYRLATDSDMVGSLLLGLYNDNGRLDHVGFTSGFAGFDRRALTLKLRKLAGGEGFSGRAPGGPSRWATERSSEWMPVAPKLVVEVSFDHVSGDRFRHGTKLLRFRPDKRPDQCRMDQIQ